jgi:flavodoxin
MAEYLKVIDAYFNNPNDEEIAKQYMKLMQEALDFSSKWNGLIECADDEKYADKFEEISRQVEEKLSELGL